MKKQDAADDVAIFREAVKAVAKFRSHFRLEGMSGAKHRDQVHDRAQKPLNALEAVMAIPRRRKKARQPVTDREMLAVIRAIELYTMFVKLTGIWDNKSKSAPQHVCDFYDYDMGAAMSVFETLASHV